MPGVKFRLARPEKSLAEGAELARNNHNNELLKKLCDEDGTRFISKIGDKYIAALASIYPSPNANDKPFTLADVKKQPTIDNFRAEFSGVGEFEYVCDLKATPMIIEGDKRTNEKIQALDFQSDSLKKLFEKSLGVVYILTCVIGNSEHIIKIGCSRTTFKQRLGSYNCGTANNWRTASTTNIKMLQSFVATRADFKLYLYDCGAPETITWHGVESVPFSSQKIYAVEDIMVKKFQEIFKQKPLANVQTSATEA
jgi:hypothetical protein